MKTKILIAAILFFSQINLPAQNKEPIEDYTPGILRSLAVGIEYKIKAGLLAGAVMPIPVPLQIRKIDSYNPLLNIMLEAEIQKNFTNSWTLSFGLKMEQKGMTTRAQVKNYDMELIAPDGKIAGVWTGGVETTVHNSYLTLPVLAVWRPVPRWGVKAGLYASYLLNGNFSGYVYDGYLREGDPTGEKISIDEETHYNFSGELVKGNYGIQLGFEYQAFTHLFTGLDLCYGINSIFPNSFKTMTFQMHPVYLNLNFGYKF
ncbi:MAG: PorT family protein [Candidatus Symbiothrix sp.]|jgi:hypothetical protein|nr:PorT family protein [Candidatus Symbiothrix sp.]